MSDDWPTVPLGTLLTDIQPGFASGRHNSEGEGIPHFRPMNVSTEGRIERGVMKYVDPSVGRPDVRLAVGDILFNNTNSPELVGKTALFEGHDNPAFSNHMTRLRVDDSKLDAEYAALRLHHAWREGWFAAHCNNHVSQASVGRDVLKQFEIELPPLDVQRVIAALGAALDESKFSASTHLSTARTGIERFHQAVLAAAWSGRLTADWRHRHPGVARVAIGTPPNSNSKTRAALESFAHEHLSDLPETWQWAPLAAVSNSVLGKMLDRAKNRGELRPYLRNINVRWRGFDLNDVQQMRFEAGEEDRFGLLSGDVLVCEGGEPGRAAVWRAVDSDMRFQKALHRVRCDTALLPEWLVTVLQAHAASGKLTDYFTGSGIAHLTGISLARVPIPLPPVEEQAELISVVDRLLASAESIEDRLSTVEHKVGRSSQAVLAKAFRGDLAFSNTVRER